jgi:DNA-binding response OmpR family regulator
VRLLLVEDDDRVASAQQDVLRRHGFDVRRVATAQDALDGVEDASWPPDVVLLDLGLPDGDGFDVCARIRRTRDLPILVTTARSDLASRVHGLNLGADDYLVKPYDLRELIARIHAVARRVRPAAEGLAGSGGPAGSAGQAEVADAAAPGGEPPAGRRADTDRPEPLDLGGVVLDLSRRLVSVGGRPVALTRKEFDLLALLARRPGIVFRREQILAEVWGASASRAGGHSLEVHVASVRAKTGVPGVIETVRGVGYRSGAPGEVR